MVFSFVSDRWSHSCRSSHRALLCWRVCRPSPSAHSSQKSRGYNVWKIFSSLHSCVGWFSALTCNETERRTVSAHIFTHDWAIYLVTVQTVSARDSLRRTILANARTPVCYYCRGLCRFSYKLSLPAVPPLFSPIARTDDRRQRKPEWRPQAAMRLPTKCGTTKQTGQASRCLVKVFSLRGEACLLTLLRPCCCYHWRFCQCVHCCCCPRASGATFATAATIVAAVSTHLLLRSLLLPLYSSRSNFLCPSLWTILLLHPTFPCERMPSTLHSNSVLPNACGPLQTFSSASSPRNPCHTSRLLEFFLFSVSGFAPAPCVIVFSSLFHHTPFQEDSSRYRLCLLFPLVSTDGPLHWRAGVGSCLHLSQSRTSTTRRQAKTKINENAFRVVASPWSSSWLYTILNRFITIMRCRTCSFSNWKKG